MSFDKYMGKEHRKPYKGSKVIDKSCRNHGDCDWCLGNRKYRHLKILQSCKHKERDYERGE